MKQKYQNLYKRIVEILSQSSSDTRMKVGAILLKDDRIISTGYNGQISGQPHIPIIINGHDISTVHAEVNALCFATKEGISTKDCEIFITHFPCHACTKLLIQAGE